MTPLLALGTPVVYTQCAAVARKGHSGMTLRGWHVPQKGNGFVAGHEPWAVQPIAHAVPA